MCNTQHLIVTYFNFTCTQPPAKSCCSSLNYILIILPIHLYYQPFISYHYQLIARVLLSNNQLAVFSLPPPTAAPVVYHGKVKSPYDAVIIMWLPYWNPSMFHYCLEDKFYTPDPDFHLLLRVFSVAISLIVSSWRVKRVYCERLLTSESE